VVHRISLLVVFVIASSLRGATPIPPAENPALKNAFAKAFRVGAAISTDQAIGNEPRALELAGKQFNTITPENLLKWQEVHPELKRYDFDAADKYVDFGQKHDMFVIGHNLVWHNQTPSWVFEDESGAPVEREALIARMREHIQSVVGRYRGRIGGWDVVNEGIADDGSMRKSKWQQIIGDDYLPMAFRFAHEADSNAELYYNDYRLQRVAAAKTPRHQEAGAETTKR
jgi:endo-1,4-beta-xylanase